MFGLQELEAFAAVMKGRSLTDSARALDLPKSTLSRRIRQLETSLGQRLLRRESNRLIPTEAGHLFYGYCDEILKQAAQSRLALDELREDVSGFLDVYCHDMLLRGWLGPLALDFMERYPALEMNLSTQVTVPGPELVDGVCVWVGSEPETAMRCEKLGNLSQGVYGHPDYLHRLGRPEHPRDVGVHCWVNLSRDNRGADLWHPREGRYRTAAPSRCFAVDRSFIQVDAIVNGGGIGLLPHWMVALRQQHHPGTLVPCFPDWQGPDLGVYLLYPHGQLPRRTQVFIAALRELVPDAW
ncbi:LysR family transcriptional regulator [Marinobacterium sp. YM272]|uniref:LysR family transcriptional regulator n=1 Tax=Marinobacterium sp. YM272 TaxID=3421654 RepID=UPI003D7F3C47